MDLSRRDLGLAADARFSAVIMFVKDDTLNAARLAQARGSAYLDISTATFEIGPEVSLHAQNPDATAILLASNWLAGASTWAALHFADQFDRIDAVRVAALLDEHDVGGEAAEADYTRQTNAGAERSAPRAWSVALGERRRRASGPSSTSAASPIDRKCSQTSTC